MRTSAQRHASDSLHLAHSDTMALDCGSWGPRFPECRPCQNTCQQIRHEPFRERGFEVEHVHHRFLLSVSTQG
jgi:hypothetical protein